MRRIAQATLGVALASGLLLACGSGSTARLQIELAPDDASACSSASDVLPTDVACLVVRVCPSGSARCAPITSPDGAHGEDAPEEIRVVRDASGFFSFDVRVERSASHRVEITAYSATGVGLASGVAYDARFGDAPLRVRLYRPEQWSCAGPRGDRGGAPLARALHQLVALPDGDVLVLGGVTGETVAALGLEGGAALQRTVEVYDVSEERFYEVGGASFARVFFEARYLRTEGGRHRVRAYGGFAAEESQAAARFDATQGFNYFGAPLLPGARAMVEDTVDLVYDPASRTIEVSSVEVGTLPRAGLDAVSEADADGRVGVVLGIETPGDAMRPQPRIAEGFYRQVGDAAPLLTALGARRFAGSLTRLRGRDAFLAWGGNVALATSMQVQPLAGELVVDGVAQPVVGGADGLPVALAFHTATRLGDGILVAGGLEVDSPEEFGVGIKTTPTTTPLVRLEVSGSMVSGSSVDSTGWEPTILHAATALDEDRVLLTGGARREGTPLSTLWDVGQALLVADDGGATVTTALPGLLRSRWGHAVATLPGDRVLVVGGFDRTDASMLRALDVAEVLSLAPPPASIASCGSAIEDAGAMARDAGRDAGTPLEDAATESDAGVGDDAGM